MKTFVCAISTFAVLLALVVINGALFSRVTDSILTDIKSASSPGANSAERLRAVNDLKKTLDDNSFLFSLSLSHDEASTLLAFVSDAEHQADGDNGQFLSALDKLKGEIERIKTAECFCLDGLF